MKGLLRQTKTLAKTGIAAQQLSIEKVYPFVTSFWQNILMMNEFIITESLKQMLATIDGDTALKDAFTTLGMIEIVNELRVIQSNIVINIKKRGKSDSKLPKMNTRQVKKEVGNALADLVSSINLAKKAHPELDYMPMVNEINVLMVKYNSKIKSRATRSKNEKTTDGSTSPASTLAAAV